MRDINYGQPLPEMVLDSLMELLGTYASPNLQVNLLTSTSIRVPASADNGQVAVAINGRWRYNTANADATHPGGAAGTYDVYVTGSDNSFAGGPEVDSTVYAFGVQIRASGSPPATALYRKIGTCVWDGSAITRIYSDVSTPTLATADFLAVVPATAAANTVKPTTDVVPLTIGATAGHTANRVEVRDSANALIASVSSGGLLSARGVTMLSGTSKLTQRVATASTTQVLDVGVTGDSVARLSVDASGAMSWGSGSGAADTVLSRSGAAALSLVGALTANGLTIGAATGLLSKMGGSAAATPAVQLAVAGDTQARFRIFANGSMEWGAGGLSAADLTLSRSSAARLAIGGSAWVNPALASQGSGDGLLFGASGVSLYAPDATSLRTGVGFVSEFLEVGSGTGNFLTPGTGAFDSGSQAAIVMAKPVRVMGLFKADSLETYGDGTAKVGSQALTTGAVQSLGVTATADGAGRYFVYARLAVQSTGGAATQEAVAAVTNLAGALLTDAVTGAQLQAKAYVPSGANYEVAVVVIGFVTLTAGQQIELRASVSLGGATVNAVATRSTLGIVRLSAV